MSLDQVAMNSEFAWQNKWWAFGGRFPLLPISRYRNEDQHNTSAYHFHWLGFRLWTMDSVDTGFEINLCDRDLGIRFRVPYLIFGFWLPLFPNSFSQKLWRKPSRYIQPTSPRRGDDD